MKCFHSFCTTYNVLNPFPLSEQLLCTFAAFLADQGLAPQTIKSYLAAVRNIQISLGFPDPREQSSLRLLKRVQAGISRMRMLEGSSPRIRLPITTHILEEIKSSLDASSNLDRVVLWAIASSAFFEFFRLGKLLPDSFASFNLSTGLVRGGCSGRQPQCPPHDSVSFKEI